MMCGSIVIVTVPTFDMVSLGGFLGSSLMTPLRLCGFDQYLAKRPSLIHFWRDRERDSARTPLHRRVYQYEDSTVWIRFNLPLADRLVILRRQVFGLRDFNGGERLACLNRLGQRRRGRLFGFWSWRRRGGRSRRRGAFFWCDIALFGSVIASSSGPGGQLALPLHRVALVAEKTTEDATEITLREGSKSL